MRSHVVLLAFVGFTFASVHPGWKDNTEYVYLVSGRTLTSLHELSDQYSGILLEAKLHVSPRPDGNLQAYITNAQYAQIHTQLPDGWDSHIPKSELNYKELGLTSKPLKIVTKDGLIQSIIVERGVTNWETNVIKSIVSQFQLDLRGQRVIKSAYNRLPQNDKLDGVFKTMEETITGESETEYAVHRLPEYLIQSEPWLVPRYELKGDGFVYEVVKNKNYTNSKDIPAYHYGIGDVSEGKPASNRLGEFCTRESSTRVILTGKLTKYTLQSAQTINKIVVNPTFNAKEQGSAISALNLTLTEVRSQSQPLQELVDPVEIGNLVYTYERPFASSNEVYQKLQGVRVEYDSSEENNETPWQRIHRSADQKIWKMKHDDISSSSSEEKTQQQTKPVISEAPRLPLLPYFVGYNGRSIKSSSEMDLKQSVQKLVKEIAEEMQHPEKILLQSTLSKYVMVCSMVRLMNQEEIRAISQQLYSQDPAEIKRSSWITFRDAVAAAGTGPALLNIEDWITTKKIEKEEAADVVSSMAHSSRVPTEEYMRHFFELVIKPEVMHEAYLNETILMAYTNLINRVYVNKRESRNQYPVYTFESFYTKEGKEFVERIVIPYLSERLDDAVSEGNSPKIHVYIRALGNTGHKKVVEVLIPYLEGKKQVSQFQRMLMVLCLDKVVKSYPIIARSILYRIYQNTAEIPEVRVAAVHQLMRTSPPVEMLQYMAQKTNYDPQEQVNAAVKSAIQTACQLKGTEPQALRKAAESARPLLTRKQYGKQQSFNLLQDFVAENMKLELKQNILQVGSTDHVLPKGVRYTLRGNMNGQKTYFGNVQAMFSSIKELTNVLYMETGDYDQSKKLRSQQSGGNKWSSAKIAENLNLSTNEREQLEGFIYAELESFNRIWSFDNETIRNLPQVIREKEQMLKNGKHYQYTKIKEFKEMAISFPTETGFPFLYTYNTPMLVQFEAKVKAVANPAISRGSKLYKPEKISCEIDGSATVSTKAQSRLSVITPFNHQMYLAGYDKNVQIHIPLKGEVAVDLKKLQVTVEYELNENHKDARLFHYSSWPYTSKSDIMNLIPIALQENTHHIKPQSHSHKTFDTFVGMKQTGMVFRVFGHHPQQSINVLQMISLLKSGGLASLWQKIWDGSSLQETEANIRLVPEQSTSKRIFLRIGFHHQYNVEPKTQKPEEFMSMDQLESMVPLESQQRQREFSRHASAGINSVSSRTIDTMIEFSGDRKYQHIFTLTFAKSNVDPRSRLLAFYKNNAQDPTVLSVQAKGYIPNTNGLDLAYSLMNEPKAKYEFLIQHRPRQQEFSVRGSVDMSRSQSRRYHLERLPLYQLCKNEITEGNHQLSACQNMTIESNYLNDINIEMQYDNINSECAKYVKDIFKAVYIGYYPMTEIKEIQPNMPNKINLRAEFHPENLRQLDVTVRTNNEESKLFNISMGEFTKAMLVPHPVFHLKSRLMAQFMGQDNIRHTCVVDKTAAQTFANTTYPLSLGDKWTVMMQYVPQRARLSGQGRLSPTEQLANQLENFVVLVRETSEQHKEIKIMFNHPKTDGKTVEIYMQSKQAGSESVISVLSNNQEIHFDDKRAADLFNGFVEVYLLPNREVKMEITDWFYIIFDGYRAKLTAISSKLHDSIVGLCGRFSDDKYEDFWTPNNCIVRSPKQFVDSFQVEGEKQNKQPQECVRKEMPLYTVLSTDAAKSESPNEVNGVRFKNRYVELDGEVCFTLSPVAECKNLARRTVTQNVPVHCITASKTAYYFKNQIDNGGNPDFSHKPKTKLVQMEIPQDCY